MIRSIFLYFMLVMYMFYSLVKKMKLEKLKKKGSQEEVQSYTYDCINGWAKFILKSMRAKIHMKGLENIPDGPCLFVSNHQGFLDIPILIASLDRTIGFIAKKEIKKVKIISYWMEQIKCIFIDRSNIRASVRSINEGVKILKNGHSLVIFPEGTRSKGPRIGEFKRGSMKLGLKSMVPIVPLAIDGSYKLREGNKHGNLKPADVNLTICKPIYPADLSKDEKENISEIIKKEIMKNIYLENSTKNL
ncbi:lysophospholipid acyltransferase family protein [Clostridium tyrobutyricum]|uniref:lysophospholipid acyltransferase family protein n=1 Tax=Clostridium tyrobutyricum TaxID=1519 RepID=UPI002010CA52|nr:lysophospholipid acyltransferase family protein [Clostridium tyrobutyricum]MBR9649365.1 1-acyl-sn-glycerol-3-phosphate acyltransferase [Clostridium tyrobutyricum]